MATTNKKLSIDEICKVDSNGKGINCAYYVPICLALIGTGFDCGTCDWILRACGYNPGTGGSGGGHGCTGG